jgi:hypothetical protein
VPTEPSFNYRYVKLINETSNSIADIVCYKNGYLTAKIDNVLNWPLFSGFSLVNSNQLPILFTSIISNTDKSINVNPFLNQNTNDNFYNNWFIRIRHVLYDNSLSERVLFRRIVSYNAATSTFTFDKKITDFIADATVEIFPPYKNNFSPIYINKILNNKCFNVRLNSIILPNVDLNNTNYSRALDINYIIVEFYDISKPNQYKIFTNTIFKNAIFTCTINNDIKENKKFIRFIPDDETNTFVINDKANYRVTIKLPNGELFLPYEEDTKSPLLPNLFIQTRLLLEFVEQR